MDHRAVEGAGDYLCSLEYGADWREEIEAFAAAEGIEAAWFVGSGAVQDASLATYDQDALEEDHVDFDEPLSVTSCVGSVALRDDEPRARAHVVLARESGQAIAGELDRATVFAGELYLWAFSDAIEWTRDETTGLESWDV